MALARGFLEGGAGAHVAREHSRSLCLAVDDFGLHSGVCQAALSLVEQERVHAIGCMVGAPAWAMWAPRLRVLDARRVDLGVHLDFTEYPLQMPARRLPHLLVQTALGSVSRAAVRAEIRAQINAFEQHVGRAPSYVDGHQHVHQFPIVREELVAELRWRYAGRLPWLRSTRAATGLDGPYSWLQALKPRVIAALGSARLTASARPLGFGQNARLLGVHDFTADADHYLDLLNMWMRASARGDVLMCHPSRSGHPLDPLSAARMAEYQALSGDAFGVLVRECGIVLQAMSRTLSEDALHT